MARRSLYLIRHAIAAERGEEWPDDTRRPLTHEGAAKMRVIVSGLDALGVEIGLVLTSPLVRAVETAEIVATGLDSHPEIVEFPTLAPGHTPAKVAEALSNMHRPPKEVALVGHEPDLGALAAWLIGGRSSLVFKKGGVARIDISAWPPVRDGNLAWFATPKMLRAVGKA
jgi:phosphohistidine phosphatase